MKPISIDSINSLRCPVQHFSDCYLVSTLSALTGSENGRKILAKNIMENADEFSVHFNKPDKTFVIPKLQEFIINKYLAVEPKGHNPIINAVEHAMEALIISDTSAKPFISWFLPCDHLFEYNKPSNFMRIFTGKNPVILNEGSLRMTLKKHKEKVAELFERMMKEKNYSFVAGTGLFKKSGLSRFHCFAVKDVNLSDNSISLYNGRTADCINMTFEKFVENFKFLVGYFNNMLK